MVICQICQHENEPDQRFCDECGVELNPGEEEASAPSSCATLAFQTELTSDQGHQIQVDNLLSLGRLNRYLCSLDNDPALLLEETATAPGLLKSRLGVLGRLEEVEAIWKPDATLTHDGRPFAAGRIPAGPTLAQRVRDNGALPPDEVRNLAVALGQLLDSVHSLSILLRSFQPERMWWDGESLTTDNFERVAPLESAGEDFQVVNGFSPPEAYGVGDSAVGVPGDLFSAGAVLHFVASGQRTDLESRENFFSFPPVPSLDDPVLEAAIGRLTAKNVQARIPTAAALTEFLESEEVPAPAAPAVAPVEQESGGDPPTDLLPSGQLCDYDVFLQSHVGCVRSINQDACLELTFTSVEKSQLTRSHLLAIIDGMGGEAEGDKAASLALRTIAQEVTESSLCLKDQRATTPLLPHGPRERNMHLLERALKRANRNIFEYAERDAARQGMGCTITACILEPDEVTIGHVGDTRAYLWREGSLTRLTTDHSLVGRLVEMGQLTEEEARNSPQRSIIYRAMGTNPEVEVDLYHQPILPGDRLMISSDGVWEYFMNEELERLMGEGDSPQPIANRLVEICLSRGADDNATLAVVFAREKA